MIDLSRELIVVLNTGKAVIGFRQSLKALTNGQAKLVIVASNAPPYIVDTIKYYAKIAGIPVYEFPGTSWDLGALIKKPFKVSTIAIIDPGESNIMAIAEQLKGG